MFGRAGAAAERLASSRRSAVMAAHQAAFHAASVAHEQALGAFRVRSGVRRQRALHAGLVAALSALGAASAAAGGATVAAALVGAVAVLGVGVTVLLAATGRPPRSPRVEPDAELLRSATLAEVGADRERRVAAVLERLPGWRAVTHGARLGVPGDADHVLFGRAVVVIETKTGAGPVRLRPEGRLEVAGRLLPGAPVRQVLRQAAALQRVSGQTVLAVVCVVDATTPAVTTYGGVSVCSLADLPTVLAARSPEVASRLGRDASLLLARRFAAVKQAG